MQNNKRNIIVVTGVVGLILLAGLVWVVLRNDDEQTSDESEAISDRIVDARQENSEMFGLELIYLDGRKVRLEELSGKAMIINAWATWCPFCVKELQEFAEVKREFGDQIEVIAIDRAESAKTAGAFIDRSGIGDDLIWLLDRGDSFYQVIGGFSMPETLFIKADGTTFFHKRGPMTASEIREKVKDMLI